MAWKEYSSKDNVKIIRADNDGCHITNGDKEIILTKSKLMINGIEVDLDNTQRQRIYTWQFKFGVFIGAGAMLFGILLSRAIGG